VFREVFRLDDHVVWLDAGAGARGGTSYLMSATAGSVLLTASVADGTITRTAPADTGSPAETRRGDVFTELARSIDEAGTEGSEAAGFRLGWVGWLGYELAAQTTGAPVATARTPDAAMLLVDRAIAFDHGEQRMRLIVSSPSANDGWVERMLLLLRSLPPEPTTRQRPRIASAGRAHWRHAPERYAELIADCQAAITRGDAYQLCLTNEVRLPGDADPADVYLRLRSTSPSHHGGFVRFGRLALLSASPEQFLQIGTDRMVTTKPIKGTRPRSPDPQRDAQLAAELLASEKERAENLMIVDLMRNDLGRVARLGSVSVSSLLQLETYAHVHQLVSTVQARLADDVGPIDAVAACFPAGSMTGAPKISAMTILHGLEAGPRGVYSGVFGYIGLDGAVDLAMVIRSIVYDDTGASIGTGGGITALSSPEEEIEETRVKARALLDAVGASES
jgi:para-aminobenzoate synthetase component I